MATPRFLNRLILSLLRLGSSLRAWLTTVSIVVRITARSSVKPPLRFLAPPRSTGREAQRAGSPSATTLHRASARKRTLCPSDPASVVSERIVSAAFSVPFGAQTQRSKEGTLTEPPHVLEIRAFLAACTYREERLRLGKLLYRRRRNWLRWVAKHRFASQALTYARTHRPRHRG